MAETGKFFSIVQQSERTRPISEFSKIVPSKNLEWSNRRVWLFSLMCSNLQVSIVILPSTTFQRSFLRHISNFKLAVDDKWLIVLFSFYLGTAPILQVFTSISLLRCILIYQISRDPSQKYYCWCFLNNALIECITILINVILRGFTRFTNTRLWSLENSCEVLWASLIIKHGQRLWIYRSQSFSILNNTSKLWFKHCIS